MSWRKFISTLFKEENIINYKVAFIEEIPEKLNYRTVYIIGQLKRKAWLIIFICPCGCQSLIHLNLLQDASPCWKYRINKKGLTINPSILRTKGCRSHFCIINNKVIWTNEWR